MVRELEMDLSMDLGIRVEVISYVDDVALVACGTKGNHDAVKQLMENTIDTLARKHGVEMAPEKTEWIASTSLTGSKKTIKWLGVRIGWSGAEIVHARERVTKAWTALRATTSIGNAAKGISPRSWNLLWRGMIAPILMWGTDVLLSDERPTGVNMIRKV